MRDDGKLRWATGEWSFVVLLGMVFIVIGSFVWWVDRNFGPLVAVMCLGLLAGAGFFMAGGAFQQRSASITMNGFADNLHELTGFQKEQWKATTQNSKLALEQYKQQIKLTAGNGHQVLEGAQDEGGTWNTEKEEEESTVDWSALV